MMLHVVTGPPASGKSTFVREHATPGAIRIDFDLMANTLAGLEPANHEHGPAVKKVALAARKAAIDKALEVAADGHEVWIIHSRPGKSTMERYRAAGAKVHNIDPGKDVVMRRCRAQRPAHLLKVAAAYYDQEVKVDKPSKPSKRAKTSARGYGYRHQKQREYLLATLVEGTPCWWCGEPMYRSQSLDADHSVPEDKPKGALADRLMHSSCNRSRQDGKGDHARPALDREAEALRKAFEHSPASVFDWPR